MSNTTFNGYNRADDPWYVVTGANLVMNVLPCGWRGSGRNLQCADCARVTISNGQVLPAESVALWKGSNPVYWGGIPSVAFRIGTVALLGSLLIFAITRGNTKPSVGSSDIAFWWYFIPTIYVLNTLPVRWYQTGSSLNENQHALVALILTFVMAQWAKLRWWGAAILLLCVIEFVPAVLAFQSELSRELPLRQDESGIRIIPTAVPIVVTQAYIENYMLKITSLAVYLVDILGPRASQVSWILALAGLVGLAAIACGDWLPSIIGRHLPAHRRGAARKAISRPFARRENSARPSKR